jgi:hypothetical protein
VLHDLALDPAWIGQRSASQLAVDPVARSCSIGA